MCAVDVICLLPRPNLLAFYVIILAGPVGPPGTTGGTDDDNVIHYLICTTHSYKRYY
jgi:hypothetical protein